MEDIHTYVSIDQKVFNDKFAAMQHEFDITHCKFIDALKAYYLGMDIDIDDIIADIFALNYGYEDQRCDVTNIQIIDFLRSKNQEIDLTYINGYVAAGSISTKYGSYDFRLHANSADEIIRFGLMSLELDNLQIDHQLLGSASDCDIVYKQADDINPYKFAWKGKSNINTQIGKYVRNSVYDQEYWLDFFKNVNKKIYENHQNFNMSFIFNYVLAKKTATYNANMVLPVPNKEIVLHKKHQSQIFNVCLSIQHGKLCWLVYKGPDRGHVYDIENTDTWRYYNIPFPNVI